MTILPKALAPSLQIHLDKARELHQLDLSQGFGEASLPYALARKYPKAGFDWGWQYMGVSFQRAPTRLVIVGNARFGLVRVRWLIGARVLDQATGSLLGIG